MQAELITTVFSLPGGPKHHQLEIIIHSPLSTALLVELS